MSSPVPKEEAALVSKLTDELLLELRRHGLSPDHVDHVVLLAAHLNKLLEENPTHSFTLAIGLWYYSKLYRIKQAGEETLAFDLDRSALRLARLFSGDLTL